jgi:hypothetical protein
VVSGSEAYRGVETATLSEDELSQYCHEKGLYSEQVKQWKRIYLDAQSATTQRL